VLTVSVTVVECDKVPLVPVIVSVTVPVGVEPAVVTVSVEDPEPLLTGVGLNVPVAPLGSPLMVKLTAPVKPLSGLTFAVYVVLAP
jgi:hypothetical protein